jgi:hypothetical protein
MIGSAARRLMVSRKLRHDLWTFETLRKRGHDFHKWLKRSATTDR